MVRIEAIIRPAKLDDVRVALDEAEVHGLTIIEVSGCGRQKGFTEHYRGSEYTINLLPKILVTIVAPEARVDGIVRTITEAARTGEVGDGKIFLSPVLDVVRIRTGERGEEAI
jgi:nitrogen regulatory protein P-II 1